jgi:hypothetical protein
MRMTVGSRGVFVGKLAMVESRSCVLLRLFVLAKLVMMGRLVVMMRGGIGTVTEASGGRASPPRRRSPPFTILLPESERKNIGDRRMTVKSSLSLLWMA